MRLIDAGKVMNAVFNAIDIDEKQWNEIKQEVDKIPAIDPETLRPTARWRSGGIDRNSYTVNWICRKCGRVADFDYKYCPNCGAQMEGRQDELHRI